MEGLWIFPVILILSAIFLPWVIMRKAQKWREIYFEEWHNYQALSSDLNHLKIDVERQADEWPMYARPVLYASYDRHAQTEFAHAQDFISEANALLPEIFKIRLPEYPENRHKILAFRENILTINNSYNLNERVGFLRETVKRILQTTDNIKKDQENNLQRQGKVFQELQLLEQQIIDTEKRIESLSQVDDDISWAHTFARRSFDTALRSTQSPTDDGREYAVADVLNRIGKDLLKYLDLYMESLQEERFILDDFARLLKDTYRYLNSMLEMDELNSWKALRKADNYLKLLPRKLKKAEASLESFKQDRKEFVGLEKLIKSYDLVRSTKRADRLQKECAFYWYSDYQRPETWRQILNDRPLPLKALLDLQNEKSANLQPIIESQQGIKQSNLPVLLDLFNSFKENYKSAIEDIKLLHNKLFEHKQAHIRVRNLINNNGDGASAVEMVDSIVKDADPTIKNEGRQIIQTYKNYCDLEQAVTGANFPELISKLYEMIDDCKILKADHENIMQELRKLIRELNQMMKVHLSEIESLIEGFPKINEATHDLFLSAQDIGQNIVSRNLQGGYEYLNQSRSAIQDWLDHYQNPISDAKNQKNAFNDLALKTKAQLVYIHTELVARNALNKVTWGWAKTEIEQTIYDAQIEVEQLWRRWNDEDGWQKLYVLDAFKFCYAINQSSDSLISEFHQKIARAEHEQSELADRRKRILSAAQSGMRRNPFLLPDMQIAIDICKSVIWLNSKIEVENALDLAQKMIDCVASAKDRRQAQTIIQNIDTGGGAYFDGNVKVDRGSTLAGRDSSSK